MKYFILLALLMGLNSAHASPKDSLECNFNDIALKTKTHALVHTTDLARVFCDSGKIQVSVDQITGATLATPLPVSIIQYTSSYACKRDGVNKNVNFVGFVAVNNECEIETWGSITPQDVNLQYSFVKPKQ